MSLPKKYRLEKELFKKIKDSGTIIKLPLFSIIFLANQSKGPKFAVVVSKKIDQKAVVRNKIKRRIHLVISSMLSQFKPDLSIIILVKHPVKIASISRIKQLLSKQNQLFLN